MTPWYQHKNGNLILSLYIQPGAKLNEVVGLHGNALKIKLAVPPIEGRANAALLQFIATQFKIPLRHVTFIRGEKSRHKIIEISGCTMNPELVFLGQ